MDLNGKNILIGASGSVAASCSIPLACELKTLGCNVKIILTKNASRFFFFDCIVCEVLTEENFSVDSIQELYEWADALIVAPIGANTLAKIAIGIYDNLLVFFTQTYLIQAYTKEKPLILAPAMNFTMWNNPFTAEHIAKIKAIYNAHIVDPECATFASNEVGQGAIADQKVIIEAYRNILSQY